MGCIPIGNVDFSLCVEALSKGRRPSHIDPTMILPQDRDIHLVEYKFCPDTNPFPALEAASAQHVSTSTMLKNHSSRNPNRNDMVTLHIILVGMACTTYNDYAFTSLIDLVLTKQKADPMHPSEVAMLFKELQLIINTRHALHFQGNSGGGVAGHVAVESRRRRVRASRSMADKPPDPH
eukprot:1157797-Pelagomonas_calceolata.AAC.11